MSIPRHLKLLYAVTFALVAVALSAKAAPLSQEILPPRLDWKKVDALPLETRDYVQADDQASYHELEPTVHVPYSHLVYQSFNDGNWEIYHSPQSTYDYRRLTYHVASDIHPRLNRGATRIVFASNRDGNYELYLINPDGTGLTRLTNNTTDDVNPTWSPDGTQIAFQSYRDSQPEIYVMDANGFNQRRLTVEPDYDGSPAWSPKGTQIAFVSRRTGGYRIYVMDPDGSNVTQLSDQPYSLDPAWSPNGTHIAFDADGDGNGWQELWVMHADGSNQSLLYNPGYKKDAWARSWSSDWKYIAFTLVSFVEYDDVWYWRSASMKGWDTKKGGSITLKPNASLDWHPGWETIDGDAPQTQINALPLFSRSVDFIIGWDGIDLVSGLDSFDIQYRIAEQGEWTDWQMATRERFASFEAIPGTTVSFRGRARDHCYNVENWSDGAKTATTFYAWKFPGRVTDNRGLPVKDAPISITPSPLYNPVTDVDGCYLVRLITSDPHTLTISRSNYISASVTITNSEAWKTLYLPPKDNVIQNGTFEVNSAQPDGWQWGGTLPTSITPDTRATGAKALVLGKPCSPPCLTEPQITVINDDPVNAVADSQGHLHIVSYDNDAIHYIQRWVDGSWTTPAFVASTGIYHYGVRPLIAIDSSDTLHVTWVDYKGLKYTYKTRKGNWATPQIIAIDINDANKYPVDIAVDSNDTVHILVYDRSKVYHFEQKVDGHWTDRFQVDQYGDANDPQLTIGPDDTLHVVWQETYSRDPRGDHLIFYRTRSPDGVWGTPAVLFDSMNRLAPDPKELLCDAEGRLHLFWYKSWNYHVTKSPSSSWSTPVQLDNASCANIVADVDHQGVVHMVNTHGSVYNRELYYRQFVPGTGWSSPIQMNNDENREVEGLIVDHSDILHLFSSSFPSDVYYQTTASANISGVASISQTITIPQTMQAPTLSFMSKASGDIGGDDTGLKVFVTDELTTTLVFSNTIGSQWILQWLDMQSWSGKTITTAFQVQQSADSPLVQTYLDDISLGSAYPDVWVTVNNSQKRVLPGDEVVFTVKYGNQSSVVASNNVITAELPPNLNLVGTRPISPATLVMPSLGWSVGDLTADSSPHTIIITAAIEPTATALTTATAFIKISTTSSEMVLTNNNAEARLFIGYFTYLPMVLRTE